MKRLLLISAILVAAAAAACQQPVSGDLGPSTLKRSATTGDDDDDDGTKTAKSADNAGTARPAASSASTGTAPAVADAAAPAAAVDPFAGAPAFAQITPGTDTTQHHLGSTNAGKDCLECHGVPDDGSPTFFMAGTAHKTATQPDGATGVQIRIVGPDGAEVALVGTDSQGNFWKLGTTQIPAGSHVAIRDGATEKKMSGPIANGSCNTEGCHDATRPLFLGL